MARRRWGVLGFLALLVASSLSVQNVEALSVGTFSPLYEPGVGGRLTAISRQPSGTRLLAAGDMLGVAWSDDDGASWLPSRGLPGYEMAEFTWDPTLPLGVWVGSMSGPAWSTDGGASFSPRRAGMPSPNVYPYRSPVQRVVYLDADTVLAFGGSQRQWSEDNGHPQYYGSVWRATRTPGGDWSAWSALSTPLAGNIVSASVAGPNLYAVVRGGTSAGVWRATIANPTSWTQLPAPGGSNAELTDVAVNSADPTQIWVTRSAVAGRRNASPGAVYRLDGNGQSWTALNLPNVATGGNVDQVTGYDAIEASVQTSGSPALPTALYVSDTGQFTKATYRSLDGGATWSTILRPQDVGGTVAYSGGADLFTLGIDPANPYRVFGGSEEHLVAIASTDNGSTYAWRDLASQSLGGAVWRGRGFSGLVATRATFRSDGLLALNAMDGGNLLLTANGGTTWTRPLASASRADASLGWVDDWMGAVDTTFGTDTGGAAAKIGRAHV